MANYEKLKDVDNKIKYSTTNEDVTHVRTKLILYVIVFDHSVKL